MGLRLSEEDEQLGADYVEHMIGNGAEDLYIKENRCPTPVSTITDVNKTQTVENDSKHEKENKLIVEKFRSAVRRGSLLSRMSLKLRHDRVAPNNIPGEVENT